MVRTHTLIALVVSVSVLGLGSCKNSHEHGSQLQERSEGKEAAESEESEAHEGLQLTKPATSLAAAIATAQKSVPDGRFLQAEIESEGGKTICSISFASGDGLREVNIDAATGKILATENEKLPQEAGEMLEAIGKDPQHAPIGVAQAIDAALAKVPGAWACYAILGREEGKLAYAVIVIDGKTARVAEVSAADGSVQKISVWAEEEESEEGMEESEGKEGKETPPAKPK
jgi:uncharacterized membrane protein YkoI